MFLGVALTNFTGSLGRRGTIANTVVGFLFVLGAMTWSRVAPYLSNAFVNLFVGVSANGYVWLGLISVVWLYFAVRNLILEARVTSENAGGKLPEKVIVLQSPREGERVVQEATVRGFTFPASSQPVQILIQSGAPNDLWWYPQLPGPRIEGYEWIKERCSFGLSNSSGGTRHSVVAISTNETITQRIKDLPADAIQSNVVTVYRY